MFFIDIQVYENELWLFHYDFFCPGMIHNVKLIKKSSGRVFRLVLFVLLVMM